MKYALQLLALITCSACSTSLSPVPECTAETCFAPPPPRQLEAPPRIALVLGGGGARGLAHVGVLEEFEKAGIQVDMIVGCSAGSIVGALYADDPNATKLRDHLLQLKRQDLLDFSWLSARFGLSEGRLLKQRLEEELQANDFEDLQIPLFVVATDLDEGELVTISSGPIAPAVQGSCAIPLVFQPVCWNGRLLVDGGVINSTPVDIAKEQNPDLIIAVDLSEMLSHSRPTNLFGVAKRCLEIRMLRSDERLLEGADILIQPDINGIGHFDDDRGEEVYEAGRLAAQRAIPLILERMGVAG